MHKVNYFLSSLFLFLFCFGIQHITAEDEWNKRVYLATYPRSGNHWMRYLIEEVTNVATGSVYCDPDEPVHLPTMFPWGYAPRHGYEGNRRYPTANDIIVIKTHFPCMPPQQLDNQPAIKVIRIIRHPVDSCYSYYVFHTSWQYVLPHSIIPQDWLEYFISTWLEFQQYWDNQPNVLTIRYEDLYNSPEVVLKKVLQAIGYKARDADIRRAVTKYPPRGGLVKHLHHFQKMDLLRMKKQLYHLMTKYHYTIEGIAK